jgi:hypothetical protein
MDKTAPDCFHAGLKDSHSPTIMFYMNRIAATCGLKFAAATWCGIIFTSTALAQFGVSPTQTGSYFDDFRARSTSMQQSGAGVRSGDVVYDYESGTYLGVENEGGMSPDDLLQNARQMSQPSVYGGTTSYAARSVGDYTNYAGQYTNPTGFFAPTYVSDPFLSGKRNLKLGPVNVGLGLYQGFEYNSNINRATTNPVSDLISTTMLNVNANYRITKNNILSLSTAIGFDHYFLHPEVSPYGGSAVLNVLPGSTLAFDIKAGPLYFTVYDRVSVRPAVNSQFTLNSLSLFGVFTNDLGVVMNYAINRQWSLALSFNNSTSRSMTGGISTQYNRTINSIQGSLVYSPHGTWSAGLELGVSDLKYTMPILNDGTMFNAGAFFRTNLGQSTYLKVSGGYQYFQFDAPSAMGPGTNTIADFSDLGDYYANVSITNQLNNRFTQVLSFGHESALNLTSNYVTATYVNYGISMITSKGGRLSLTTYLEDSSPSALLSQGNTQQEGFDLYYSHQITSKVRMGLGYHLGRSRVSDIQGNAANHFTSAPAYRFIQHAFNADLSMALTQKASLMLGYRYYTNDTQGINQSFDQHRFIMGLNYNF